ncbi:hypothetical protein QP246_11280, partial [Aerococcus urinae]|nr:hypothetical protein [Aerococcus urinae]
SHANYSTFAIFVSVGSDTHALNLILSNAFTAKLIAELLANALNNLKVAWQKFANKLCWPNFQSFWKKRVASVVEGLGGNAPSG